MDREQDNREYAKTHPWITFRFSFKKLNEINWMRIGESLSKSDHIAGVPLAPAVAQELHIIYLAKGVHATTQIEGNTLTEDEVRQQLQGELKLPESQEYLGIETKNIADACLMVIQELADGKDMTLTAERIKLFNKMVLAGLDPEEGAVPGEVRTHSVVVGNAYRGAPAEDGEYLLARLCDWLRDFCDHLPQRYHRPAKILRAVLAHLYIAWIHPFGNGNGRTARLIEFQLLADAGFPTPACHLLSNYYNRTKTKYYAALAETSRNPTHPVEHFISYALDGLVEELREVMKKIRHFQMMVAWTNYVHQRYAGVRSEARVRQRELVLCLDPGRHTPVADLRRLTPSLAEKYAGKQQKTISRDVNSLEAAGLVQHTRAGVRPMIEKMEAFLPIRQS